MKKIKIMLVSLLVLAVVGGALAFKANTRFTLEMCTTPAWQDAQGNLFCTTTPGSCPLYENKQTTDNPGQVLCTTTPAGPLQNNCNGKTDCTFRNKIIND